MYNEILELIIGMDYSKKIMDGIDPNIEEYDFIQKIIENKIFKTIDWSGEYEDGEIISFVIQKVKKFNNETININKKIIYDEIENKKKKELLKEVMPQ